jgi:hypothetical protein
MSDTEELEELSFERVARWANANKRAVPTLEYLHDLTRRAVEAEKEAARLESELDEARLDLENDRRTYRTDYKKVVAEVETIEVELIKAQARLKSMQLTEKAVLNAADAADAERQRLESELKEANEKLRLAQEAGVAKLEQWRQMTAEAQVALAAERTARERTQMANGHLLTQCDSYEARWKTERAAREQAERQGLIDREKRARANDNRAAADAARQQMQEALERLEQQVWKCWTSKDCGHADYKACMEALSEATRAALAAEPSKRAKQATEVFTSAVMDKEKK